MSDEFEAAWHNIPYTHAIFQPGTMVFVRDEIRLVHPLCPAAGRVVLVVSGTYGRSDIASVQEMIEYEERMHPHEKKVPVFVDGCVFLIDETYVWRRKMYASMDTWKFKDRSRNGS